MYRARHERPTRPTATVRRSPWGAAALTSAAAGITALGVRMLSATAFYGDADLVRIGTGSFTVVLGIGLVLLGVRSLRSRVRVFPDRLEARSGFAPTHVVRPGGDRAHRTAVVGSRRRQRGHRRPGLLPRGAVRPPLRRPR
ncbi:hypothetical protein [Curtobacterium sp. MCPF17_052]|uniref:hypothetical protein n=1 Tax=Curtobacterium sp. MCPF17_052 TaxID=2175655 RepID=UPI0024DFA7B9|nr:hypothetical protein [Curtobacterium sp. MCPF17_052]WIB11909.1 hypothetical protein DEJ36_13710 [Curtobacterium sp. MCPF17_052]